MSIDQALDDLSLYESLQSKSHALSQQLETHVVSVQQKMKEVSSGTFGEMVYLTLESTRCRSRLLKQAKYTNYLLSIYPKKLMPVQKIRLN